MVESGTAALGRSGNNCRFQSSFRTSVDNPLPIVRYASQSVIQQSLIPWNSCGAYMAAVLGVPTMLYLPWRFFNIASPLLTLLLGYTGFRSSDSE